MLLLMGIFPAGSFANFLSHQLFLASYCPPESLIAGQSAQHILGVGFSGHNLDRGWSVARGGQLGMTHSADA